jgi:hypothetical protein
MFTEPRMNQEETALYNRIKEVVLGLHYNVDVNSFIHRMNDFDCILTIKFNRTKLSVIFEIGDGPEMIERRILRAIHKSLNQLSFSFVTERQRSEGTGDVDLKHGISKRTTNV